MIKFIDLTNKKFGRLTVVKRGENYISPNKKSQESQWWCKCDCGNENLVLVRGNFLRNGHTQSCGCLIIERLKSYKKYNTYDLSGDYGIGYTIKNEEFYFDLEDYDLIKDYCWRIDKDTGYVVASDYYNQTTLIMHRLIFNLTDENNIEIDHKRHKNNDNRKSELRLVNRSQNSINRGIQSNNTSGITGVHWHKQANKWQARVKINQKSISLGLFSKKEDAIIARKIGEEKYFGEYAYDNSIK